ncbi:MAG: hypothetical protein ISS94_01665 [Candidatus Syntrophoarchaeum sp.]|nr:hypothetical protein [Candidatus Syntrophoarchaeum sp.]
MPQDLLTLASFVASIISILAVIIGGIVVYFKFIVNVEHRLTKIETRLNYIPTDSSFRELYGIIRGLIDKIPTSSNPSDRRTELLEKLKNYEITPEEADELREIVERDVERSGDKVLGAIALMGLGALIGYALGKLLEANRSMS